MTFDRIAAALRTVPIEPAKEKKRGPRPGKAVSVTVAHLTPEEVKRRKAQRERAYWQEIRAGSTPRQQEARREYQALRRQKQGRPKIGRPRIHGYDNPWQRLSDACYQSEPAASTSTRGRADCAVSTPQREPVTLRPQTSTKVPRAS